MRMVTWRLRATVRSFEYSGFRKLNPSVRSVRNLRLSSGGSGKPLNSASAPSIASATFSKCGIARCPQRIVASTAGLGAPGGPADDEKRSQ
jgi:hypothetical protein